MEQTDTSTGDGGGLPTGLVPPKGAVDNLPTFTTPSGVNATKPDPGTLKGRARFFWTIQQVGLPPGAAGFDSWIQGLPEDPTDIEYTRYLRQEKQAATQRDAARKRGETPAAQPHIDPMNENNDNSMFPWRQNKAPENPRIKGLPTAAGDGPQIQGLGNNGQIRSLNTAAPTTPATLASARTRTAKQKAMDEAAYRTATSGRPLVEGLPVDETNVFGDPANPSGVPDAYVQKWVAGEDLGLDNNNAAVAARTGNWVYVGESHDANGGKGFQRSLYVYVDDANSQLAGMSGGQIKAYQKKLEMPETGILTPELQSLWTNAVKIASEYARQGKKVELSFIFDQQVASVVASKAASGGAAGSKFADETPTDLAGADYYQAMMQVLGDISGVGSGQA